MRKYLFWGVVALIAVESGMLVGPGSKYLNKLLGYSLNVKMSYPPLFYTLDLPQIAVWVAFTLPLGVIAAIVWPWHRGQGTLRQRPLARRVEPKFRDN